MTKELSILDPDLKEIVNMSMNKKDLMDMVESDIRTELEGTGDLIRAKYEKNKEDGLEFAKKVDTFMENLLKKQAAQFRAEVANIEVATGKPFATSISSKICSSRYDGNRSTAKDLVFAEVRLGCRSSYGNSSDEGDTGINMVANYYKKMSQPELKKYIDLRLKQESLIDESKSLRDMIGKNEISIKALPQRLKKVSAELSRKALNSSKKGKDVLKLLDQLRGK